MTVFSYDTAEVQITSDEDMSLNWDDVNTVTVDDNAVPDAFETDQFYALDVTAARPVAQRYQNRDGSEVTRLKPAEELKRAAWTLDNAAWTYPHPETGVIRSVNDVHGFFRDSYYDEDTDRLRSTLHVPTNDDDAQSVLESSTALSIGFWNDRVSEYEGAYALDADTDDIDEYQVDIIVDHCASVPQGRCSTEQGCGVQADMATDVHVSGMGSEENSGMPDYEQGDIVQWQVNPQMMGRVVHVDEERSVLMVEVFEHTNSNTMQPSGFTITAGFTDVKTVEKGIPQDSDSLHVTVEDETTTVTTKKQQTAQQSAENDAPSGIYVDEDGNWFGIGPEEGGGEPKYDLNNCNDVKDAWNLRNNGDFSVDVSTLEARIKRAADSHGCPPENRPWEDNENDSAMTDIQLDTGDLSLDKVAEMNDEVAEVIEERNRFKQQSDALDDLRDTLEIDEDVCPCDVVEDLLEDYEDLEQDLQSYEQREREEVIERIEQHTDRYEDQYEEMDLDELKHTADTVEELAADVKGAGGGDEGGSSASPPTTDSAGSYNRVWIGERRNDIKGE